MARWVIAVVGDAPCQCRLPGGIHTTSPGRISSTGPPSICTRPTPAVTMSVCPSGWVCHALRALGSNVTYAPDACVDSFAWNSGSMRTEPVKYSAGAFSEGCMPPRAIESETTVAAATMFMSVLSEAPSQRWASCPESYSRHEAQRDDRGAGNRQRADEEHVEKCGIRARRLSSSLAFAPAEVALAGS